MFPRSCGRCFSFEDFWAAPMEPALTFPPLSPGWPGYDINDDAKMYMQAMVFFYDLDIGVGAIFMGNYWDTFESVTLI
mgnify:CR=1 FL=1